MRLNKEFRNRVRNYIEESINSGYSIESVKKSLVLHGYHPELASKLVSSYNAQNFIRKTTPLLLVLALLSSLVFFFYKPSITTLAFVSKEYNYTDYLGLALNESLEYEWNVENRGFIKSIKLNGEVKDSGAVQIYLKHENQTYLVFDSGKLEKTGIGQITGFVAKNEEIIINTKDNLTSEEQATLDSLIEDINKTRNNLEIKIEVSDSISKDIEGNITDAQESILDGLINLLDGRVNDKKDKVTLKIISDFEELEDFVEMNQTLDNETSYNETLANESIDLNNTIDESNISAEINETIVINATNATIINETLANDTANISKNKIDIILEYKRGSLYDEDDNGLESINGVVDLTVENSAFSWNVSEEDLCTRWDIYSEESQQSTVVCYGSDKCCEFVGLAPKRDKWNEPYYASYGHDEMTLHNIVSAQVIHVDYNLSVSEPFAEIYNSEWKNVTVQFYEWFNKFSNVCVETCALPNLNDTSYRLIIDIFNSSLILDSISYDIIKYEALNSKPSLLKNFSDMSMYNDQSYAINLSEYFYDEDNDAITFSYYNSDLSIQLINETALLNSANFTGTTYIFFTANDSIYTTASNVFKVEVKEHEKKEEASKILKSLRSIIGLG
ncbi:hypothetical protein HYY70_00495 [Candidatus Woesearchaeota archaeon]|nr:hypothetical protein [Candidatus Woesearchaeota archaeon]